MGAIKRRIDMLRHLFSGGKGMFVVGSGWAENSGLGVIGRRVAVTERSGRF